MAKLPEKNAVKPPGRGREWCCGAGAAAFRYPLCRRFSGENALRLRGFRSGGRERLGIGEGTRMHFLHRARGRSERLQKGLQACGNFGIAGVVRMQPVRQKFFL